MNRILFETPRTTVCELSDADVPRLVALDADPEVMRYINGGVPTPEDAIRTKLSDWTARYDAPKPHGFWAIWSREAMPDFLGWVHMRPDRFEPAVDELGYRLRRAYWGKGLATEVARRALELTLQDWGRTPVVAGTLLANLASQRVMEKIGMYREFEFVYPEYLLPGWSEVRRRAVRYRIDTL